MKLSNKTYDICKWIVLTVMPALAVLITVIGSEIQWSSTSVAVTILNAVAAFLGASLGLSSLNYQEKYEGEKEKMREITRMISQFNYHEGNKVEYIVIHDVGAVSSARNNAIYFGGGDRQASAHYFVDDVDTIQVVEEFNGAWHVGDGANRYGINNSNSIGIEMCLQANWTVSAKTREETLALTRYLMKKYNVPSNKVVRHYDASRKNCPGSWSANNWAEWDRFKRDLGQQEVPKTFKVGDRVRIIDALYVDSTGNGRSTAMRGKEGVIKRDVNTGKRYLIENWGWADANDIELVSVSQPEVPKPTPNPLEYAESGTFTLTMDGVALRLGNTPTSPLIVRLNKGASVKYDYVKKERNGYIWVRQTPKRVEGYAWIATGETDGNANRKSSWGTFK